MLACNKQAEVAQESPAVHTANDNETTTAVNMIWQILAKMYNFVEYSNPGLKVQDMESNARYKGQ